MNTAILYFSKYGCAKQYAQWLKEKTVADIFDGKKADIAQLAEYDTLVFAGGLYAGAMSGQPFIAKHFDKLKEKHLVALMVATTPPEAQEALQPAVEKNFPGEMGEKIKVFHLHGDLNFQNLSFMHKMMMGMMGKILRKKEISEQTEIDKKIIAKENVLLSSEGDLTPVVDYLAALHS